MAAKATTTRRKPYETPQAISVVDLAKRLACNPKTVYGAIERGEIRVIRLGRIIRVPVAEVERLLAARQPA